MSTMITHIQPQIVIVRPVSPRMRAFAFWVGEQGSNVLIPTDIPVDAPRQKCLAAQETNGRPLAVSGSRGCRLTAVGKGSLFISLRLSPGGPSSPHMSRMADFPASLADELYLKGVSLPQELCPGDNKLICFGISRRIMVFGVTSPRSASLHILLANIPQMMFVFHCGAIVAASQKTWSADGQFVLVFL
ncbi:hypothetical protein LZ32DRAFT_69141 [Colletotrichum eremochloae]|nr:hypothetical protein LZ32DRAFT_69141 [Colletotrichum eremochloae]